VRAAALGLLVILAACANSSGAVAQPPSPSPGVIAWPAIAVEDTDSFGIDISGTGTGVSKVDIRNRFGTVTLGGRPVSALVYKGIPWNSYSLVLYQALAVEPHSWTVFWFYCTGRALTYVYWESTTSSNINKEPMTGSCKSASTLHTAVSWPAGSMPAPAPVAGFSVHGAQIEISSAAPGHAALDGKTWMLYPYALVDCSKSCGAPGWYELHSLLWDSETGETAYGIVYLITGQPHRVQLEYALELPMLGRPADVTFAADWSRN
jgi:hypothetical protein